MAEVTFPEGISVKDPHESAPDFVQGRISMKKDELIPWLQKQEGEWVNCSICRWIIGSRMPRRLQQRQRSRKIYSHSNSEHTLTYGL